AIAAGSTHSCAATSSGVQCWGSNDYGQLGDGTTTARRTPVNVAGIGAGVVALTAGNAHTCALFTSGDIYCWGANASGQVGTSFGSTTPPVKIPSINAKAIAAGGDHTCALTTTGEVMCWGDNGFGEVVYPAFGNPTTKTIAIRLPNAVTQISAFWGG